MEWQPDDEEKEYLKLIQCMTMDCIFGRGVDTAQTYISNLQSIINRFPNQNIADVINTNTPFDDEP